MTCFWTVLVCLFWLGWQGTHGSDKLGQDVDVGRITHGRDAKQGEFPDMVRLTNGRIYCGGSLINESWVLTAAHCFNNADQLGASVGEYDVRSGRSGKWHEADLVIKHPLYSRRKRKHDIALVRLSKPASHVTPMEIASDSSKRLDLKSCTVAGWGQTHYRNRSISQILQKYTGVVFPDRACKLVYRKQYHPTNVCLVGLGGPCFGDSGGPLICDSVVVGVASYTSKTCTIRPSVFTRVSKYHRWITRVIERNPPTLATKTFIP